MKNMRTDSMTINIKAIALCVAMAVLITTAGIVVTTWLIYIESLPMDNMSFALVISLLTGCMLPAIAVASRLSNRWGSGALYAGSLLIIIAALDAILFHGQMRGLLPAAIVILGGTAAAIILSGLKQKKSKHPYKKIRNG